MTDRLPNGDDDSTLFSYVKELRIGGGGGKGAYSFPGVYERLYNNGLSSQTLDYVTGISIGSLLSLGVVLGVKPEKFRDFMGGLDGASLMDPKLHTKLGMISQGLLNVSTFLKEHMEEYQTSFLFQILGWLSGMVGKLFLWLGNHFGDAEKSSGWCQGTKLQELCQSVFKQFSSLGGSPTFKQLQTYLTQHNITTKLRVVSTDLSRGCQEIFSVDSFPDLKIETAISASIAIPVILPMVAIHNPNTGEHHDFVDGGVRSNIPPVHHSLEDRQHESLIVQFLDEGRLSELKEGRKHQSIESLWKMIKAVFWHGYDDRLDGCKNELDEMVLVDSKHVDTLNWDPTPKQRVGAYHDGQEAGNRLIEHMKVEGLSKIAEKNRKSKLLSLFKQMTENEQKNCLKLLESKTQKHQSSINQSLTGCKVNGRER